MSAQSFPDVQIHQAGFQYLHVGTPRTINATLLFGDRLRQCLVFFILGGIFDQRIDDQVSGHYSFLSQLLGVVYYARSSFLKTVTATFT